MRRSVERKQQRLRSSEKRRHFWRQRLPSILIISIAVASCALFLAYSNWQQVTAAKARAEAQAKAFADIDQQVKLSLQKKIDDAKKAEAAAKAQAAADTAARKSQAITHPLGTTASIVCDVTAPTAISVVVNKKHCFNPSTWAPSDLASVDGFLLRAEAATHLSQMMTDAAAAGVALGPSSAYRSYDNQVTTYNNWVAVNGSAAAADTVSARPGYSEHQTGLAVDLKAGSCALECFATTAQYQWLQQHAASYGFIERYPPGLTSITGYSPEAWHWRYVGSATAQDMKQKDIQTLEQYVGATGGDYAS